MIQKLFCLGLMLIPFTGIQGLPFLGELRGELSAHIFIITLGLALFPSFSKTTGHTGLVFTSTRLYGLPLIFLVMMGVIILSFAANFSGILESQFLGRSGFGKFLSANVLILYGFALATLTYGLAGETSWEKLIVKPLGISVLICASFSIIEMGRFIIPALSGPYETLSSIVNAGFKAPIWDTRLRSVASEPPDFANSAGYIWPWLLAAVQFSKGKQRWIYFTLWMVLNIMILLSEARTSLVVVSGLFAVFFALRFIYLPTKPRAGHERNIPIAHGLLMVLLPLGFLLVGLHADRIVHIVIAGERVSNISRLASITAALHMFRDHPIFGLGFGQFGFHINQYMPSWGFLSYEVREWLSGESTFWPAVYSIYGRMGADMGLLGLLMWIGLWLLLAHLVLMATVRHQKETGELPFASYPLIMSCFCVLLAGIPNDSMRAPMIWITMGLACRYLFTLKENRTKVSA